MISRTDMRPMGAGRPRGTPALPFLGHRCASDLWFLLCSENAEILNEWGILGQVGSYQTLAVQGVFVGEIYFGNLGFIIDFLICEVRFFAE